MFSATFDHNVTEQKKEKDSPEKKNSAMSMERQNEKGEVQIVCPSVSDLCRETPTDVLCPVTGCGKIVKKPAALRMHLIKTHQVYKNADEKTLFTASKDQKKNITKHYYCPIDGCSRCIATKRPFMRLNQVKLHYIKMHGVKKLECKRCKKKFGTKSDLNRHERNCGQIFKCTCGCPYTTREALQVHAKRQGHLLPAEFIRVTAMVTPARQPPTTSARKSTSPNKPANKKQAHDEKSQVNRKCNKPIQILPKQTVQLVPLVIMPIPVSALPLQTVPAVTLPQEDITTANPASDNYSAKVKASKKDPPRNNIKNTASVKRVATIQSGVKKKKKAIVKENFQNSAMNTDVLDDVHHIETQTPGDFIIKQAMMSVDTDTQTNQSLALSVDAYTCTGMVASNNDVMCMETQTGLTAIPMGSELNTNAVISTVQTLDLELPPTMNSETQTLHMVDQQGATDFDISSFFQNHNHNSSLEPDVMASVASTLTQTDALMENNFGELSNSQTQSLKLLHDLMRDCENTATQTQSSFQIESSATQTQESYLNEVLTNDVQNCDVQTLTDEQICQFANTNSIQTETVEFDIEKLISDGDQSVGVDFSSEVEDVEFLNSYAQTNMPFTNGADCFTQTGSDLFEFVNMQTQTGTTVDVDSNTITQTDPNIILDDLILPDDSMDRQVQVNFNALTQSTDIETQTSIVNHLTDAVELSDMQTQTFQCNHNDFPLMPIQSSNMETQTLFTDLGISTDVQNSLTDSHTQTHFRDVRTV
ncbi:uncharacterized protein LOC100378387 [Saccoglossus kowalevskii]|uniref:ATM interactor-like n=1 Tax=Saccoglossus kowalevskii TaxID=10224 RepID=A0ABM0GWQ8_SACKO|nr:PREDICTED: ATM interactor-like [Saccoglossus kowalevskii]